MKDTIVCIAKTYYDKSILNSHPSTHQKADASRSQEAKLSNPAPSQGDTLKNGHKTSRDHPLTLPETILRRVLAQVREDRSIKRRPQLFSPSNIARISAKRAFSASPTFG